MLRLLRIALASASLLIAALHAVEAVPDTTEADPALAVIERATLALTDGEAWEAALQELQDLGDERVKTVFSHIENRRLRIWQDRPVLAVDVGDGRSAVSACVAPVDAENRPTGAVLATVASSEVGRYLENRRARKAVLGALTLIDLYARRDAARLAAAKDVGNKRVTAALPRLRELASADPVAAIRRVAESSIALIVLTGNDPEAAGDDSRLAAAIRLGELRSIRAVDALRERQASEGLPAGHAAAIAAAITSIESHQSFTTWCSYLFSGLSLGSILILTSLGLAITFGLMGVINMAHGEMLMLGAVSAWACYEFIGSHLPPQWFDWYYLIALPLSFLVAAVTGVLVEYLIVRHLYKRPLDSMLATIGVSYLLVQAVRLWKGDNLGMTAPGWFSGGWEIIQDVVLPYNRLFIIGLTATCVLGVMAIFRYTRFGLMLRATVQNREMAAAGGVNTRLVDLLTFALGSGIAGIAGSALVLMTNPSPEMGASYIVKSFLVVVVGGVGNLLGVVISGLGLGFMEKIIEPFLDATWAQVVVLVVVVLFIQRRPGGLFPERGRQADRADTTTGAHIQRVTPLLDRCFSIGFLAIFFILVPLLYGLGGLSPEFVTKLGYILTFAICAIGLDLIWGYTGVLGLCQALFFALGGYAMGLYLANHGLQAPGGIPECLSYVMSDVDGGEPPWFLAWFRTFPLTLVLGLILPSVVAFLVAWTTFRSRVKGVYVAILTQAVTVAANLVFMKNDLKLGGTNGLARFDTILGFPIAGDTASGPFAQTRFWLYAASALVLGLAIWFARALARGGLGRVLVAVRDDETRLRFCGYRVWAWKTLVFTVAATLAAVAGMLYVPQKGIINPHQMLAEASILVVAWVAVGGRGTVWGAVIGAIIISLTYDTFTSHAPQYWKLVLGSLFILVTLFLPGGLMSTVHFLPRPGRIGRGPADAVIESRGGAA